MLEVLKPVVKQLDETYDALRISLGMVSDEELGWSAGPNVRTVTQIAMHIARGNVAYAGTIGPAQDKNAWDTVTPVFPRTFLMEQIDSSQQIAHHTLEGVTDENIGVSRCDDWSPNCPEQVIKGPLDAMWFAQQMVRHTAYHLGQINLYLQLLGK